MAEREQRVEFPELPAPQRVGMTDVERVEQMTARYRSIDYPCGGGACRNELERATAWGERLLGRDFTADVRPKLLTAVADLYNVAGWSWFDTGGLPVAWRYWKRALELATDAGNDDLAINVRYRMGRAHLHHGQPERALELFSTGDGPGDGTGDGPGDGTARPHTMALLAANRAWAHAELDNETDALDQLGEATDLFARSTHGSVRSWSAFFDRTDFTAMTGVVHTRLAKRNRKHAPRAIRALTSATQSYGYGMARSRVFSLVALATAHLLDANGDEAERVGLRAVEAGRHVKSSRVVDRMRPLEQLADRRGCGHLATAIRDFAEAA